MMIFAQHIALSGLKRINGILLRSAVLLFIALYFVLLPFDAESLEGIGLFFLEVLIVLLPGLVLVYVMPTKLREGTLFCYLLFTNGYFLFWLYVFSLVRFTGLGPWMIGKSPWT